MASQPESTTTASGPKTPTYSENGYADILPEAPTTYGDNFQLALWMDLEFCTGCRACTIGCKSENNTPVGVDYTRVIYVESGKYPDTRRYAVPMPCMQCGKPPCLAACPVGAISKNTKNGIVEIDSDRCIGCRYCVWACPFGAPQYSSEKRITEKCTLCSHKTVDANGDPTGKLPACVSTCVGRMRIFGDVNWMSQSKRKTRALQVGHTQTGAQPSALYTPAP